MAWTLDNAAADGVMAGRGRRSVVDAVARVCRRPLTVATVVLLLTVPAYIDAQRGQGPPVAPQTAREAAAVDLTGTWVSVITEDWAQRMVTRKGDYTHLPLTPAARRVADTWDPVRDEATGEQCKGYGAAAITRLPGRLRIGWQDDNTMKLEYEAGTQTRLFRFGATPPVSEPSWQGESVAEWRYTAVPPRNGELKVVTDRLRAGYLRKNGVPYSANATLTEYYHRMSVPTGDLWLTIVTEVTDPENLREPFVLSTHFKKLPDGAAFAPEACSAS
jgi:hypothetical protein